MADRFFHPEPPRDGRIFLVGDEAMHLARVARHQEGDVVEIFDGHGLGYLCRVESISRDEVILSALEPIADRVPSVSLTLAVALPKGDRADWLIEKATEVGIARVVPLLTVRSVVDARSTKIDRLRRTIVEASKQCGRNTLMTLDHPKRLVNYFNEEAAQTRLLAHAGGLKSPDWPSFINGSVTLAVGPEGGWSDVEVLLASERGWTLVDLGPTRLRVETAAIVGASLVFCRTGGMLP